MQDAEKETFSAASLALDPESNNTTHQAKYAHCFNRGMKVMKEAGVDKYFLFDQLCRREFIPCIVNSMESLWMWRS